MLFTSPLYTKVMFTTVKIASIATVGALILAYPLAYALRMSSNNVRALILVFFNSLLGRHHRTKLSWMIMLSDNSLVNEAIIGLGIVSGRATPVQSVQRHPGDRPDRCSAHDHHFVRRDAADQPAR